MYLEINFLIGYFAGEDALNSSSLSPSMDNVANELAGMTLEQQEEQKEEWRHELSKVNCELIK